MSFLIVLAALCFLMFVAYRGYSVILFAPVAALGAVLLTDPSLVAPMFTGLFMDKMVGFLKLYFPVFLLGALFGKVIELSGFSKSIVQATIRVVGAQRAMLSIVLVCALLTYGGVSLFVVVFAVYPFAAELFRQGDIPKRLIPGTIALGAFTFTMDALPGTPQIQNAIPMPFFKTTVYAAPILGTICGAMMFALGIWWLTHRAKKANAQGEFYGDHPQESFKAFDDSNLPSLTVALMPIILVLVLNFVFSEFVYSAKAAGYDYLKDKPFLTTLGAVRGIWALIVSLLIAIVFAITLNWKRFTDVKESVNQGVFGSMLPILNTASEVGYGNVVKTLAAFAIVQAALLALSDNPLITSAVATNVLAGITGSASGGMSIALGAMGDIFYQQAIAMKINPEVLHRVVAMACGGLDTLPHNGAVVTLLGITQLTHRQSYADIGMVSVIIPIAVTVVGIVLGTMGVV